MLQNALSIEVDKFLSSRVPVNDCKSSPPLTTVDSYLTLTRCSSLVEKIPVQKLLAISQLNLYLTCIAFSSNIDKSANVLQGLEVGS